MIMNWDKVHRQDRLIRWDRAHRTEQQGAEQVLRRTFTEECERIEAILERKARRHTASV